MYDLQQKRRALVRLTGDELAREAAEAYKELCWYEALSRGRADLYVRGLRLAAGGKAYTEGGVPS
jgi:hypothetical protein